MKKDKKNIKTVCIHSSTYTKVLEVWATVEKTVQVCCDCKKEIGKPKFET
ncbi:hypothetical protein [Flavobacterium davisii]|nr:hypothetical protein [Flavobacterium davisii]